MNEEQNLPLRRRVPGAARAAPAQAAPPALPEDVLRRMQAAVDAARVGEAAQSPVAEPSDEITAPLANKDQATASAAPARGRVLEFRHPAKRQRAEPAGKPPRTGHLRRRQDDAGPAQSETQVSATETAAPPPAPGPALPPGPEPRANAPSAAAVPALPKRTRVAGAPRPAPAPERTSARERPDTALPPPMRTVPTPAADWAALTSAEPAPPPAQASPAATVRPAAPAGVRPGVSSPSRVRPRKSAGRARRLIGIAACLVLVLAAGIAIAIATRASPDSAGRHKISALQRHELANSAAAVAWIGEQVSRDSVIACDPRTCAALKALGYPAGKLQVLGPTSPYPRTAALVVETGSVSALYGTSLRTDFAPTVLATFGTGAAEVDIRLIAPDGVPAYQKALAADLANRKQDGSSLLHGSQIAASTTAREQMTSGAVDSRLLLAIAAVAAEHPVDILGFGNDAVGASPGIPLRYCDLSERVPAARMAAPAYVQSVIGALGRLPAAYRPIRTLTVRLARGVVALRIEFAAPSPLGLLGPTPGG
jgi:hypothetical protein